MHFVSALDWVKIFYLVVPKTQFKSSAKWQKTNDIWQIENEFFVHLFPVLLTSFRIFLSILRWFSLGPEQLAKNGGETEKMGFQLFRTIASSIFWRIECGSFFSTSKASFCVLLIKLFFRIGPHSVPNLVQDQFQMVPMKGRVTYLFYLLEYVYQNLFDICGEVRWLLLVVLSST